MKKLWIRWAGLFVFVALMGSLFLRLGVWQMHRLEWRRGINARVVAHEKAPVKPYEQVFSPSHTITDTEQWQRVTLTGTFDRDPRHQMQALYRSMNDAHGSEAITPLRTTRGEWILIDRGFLPRPSGGNEVAVIPAPPAGQVTITGYVRRDEEGKDSATVPVNGLAQLIAAPKIAKMLPYPILDGYVSLQTSNPPQPGGLQPVATPALDEGPHLSYALQWLCFTLIAIGGFFVLVRSDLKNRKKELAKAERRERRLAEAAASEARQEADAQEAGAQHAGQDGGQDAVAPAHPATTTTEGL